MSYNMEPTLAYENKGFSNGDDNFGSYNSGRLVQRGAYRHLGPLARILVPLSTMAIELFERMTYYTITAGILFYTVSNLQYNIHNGGLLTLGVFSGGAYMVAPLGGYLADAFFGRFYTILASTIVYIAGLAVLVTGSFDTSQVNMEEFGLVHRNNMALAGLIMIVLGTGGIKANVAPFGADQIRSLGEKTVTSYFNWYYFVINIGSVVALMGVNQLRTDMYMGTALLVPLCGMAAALLLFAAMHGKYVKYRGERHRIGRILCQGCSKCTSDGTCFAGAMERFGGSEPDHVVIGFSSAFKTGLLSNFVLFAWVGVSLLVLATPLQSQRMDRHFGSTEIPDWVYTAFPQLAVLLAIPFLALGVLPLFRDRGKFNLTIPRRIGLGLVFVALGLLTSGAVESARKETLKNGQFVVKNFPPSPDFINFMLNDPAAKVITDNVMQLEVQKVLQKANVSQGSGDEVSAPGVAAQGESSVVKDKASNTEVKSQLDEPMTPSSEDSRTATDFGRTNPPGDDTTISSTPASDESKTTPRGDETKKASSQNSRTRRAAESTNQSDDDATLSNIPAGDESKTTPGGGEPKSSPSDESRTTTERTNPPGDDTTLPDTLEDTLDDFNKSKSTEPPAPEASDIALRKENILNSMISQVTPLLPTLPNKTQEILGGMMAEMEQMVPYMTIESLEKMSKMVPQLLPQMNLIPPAALEQYKPHIMKLLPALLQLPMDEAVSKLQNFFGSVVTNTGVMIAVHLVLKTPDGFPLWKLTAPMMVSNMSLLTQIPQFMLVGVGEALAAVAGLELAYCQAPFAFQGLTTGLYVMVMGLGSFMSGYLIQVIDGLTEECNPLGLCAGTWFSPTGGDINDQNMDYMMYLVAGIVSAAFLLYLVVSTRFYRLVDPMSFGELEESELPGIEMKSAGGGGDSSDRTKGNGRTY